MAHGTLHITVQLLQESLVLLCHQHQFLGFHHLGISIVNSLQHLCLCLALTLAIEFHGHLAHLIRGTDLASHIKGLLEEHRPREDGVDVILHIHAGEVGKGTLRGNKARRALSTHRKHAAIHSERTAAGIIEHTCLQGEVGEELCPHALLRVQSLLGVECCRLAGMVVLQGHLPASLDGECLGSSRNRRQRQEQYDEILLHNVLLVRISWLHLDS